MLLWMCQLSSVRLLPPFWAPRAHPDAVLHHGLQAGALHIVYLHVLHERNTSASALHAQLMRQHVVQAWAPQLPR